MTPALLTLLFIVVMDQLVSFTAYIEADQRNNTAQLTQAKAISPATSVESILYLTREGD
jgi:hypothetical protein